MFAREHEVKQLGEEPCCDFGETLSGKMMWFGVFLAYAKLLTHDKSNAEEAAGRKYRSMFRLYLTIVGLQFYGPQDR